MAAELFLRFVPSHSEGLPEVTEVVVYPDRLEFQTAGEWKIFPFEDMVRLPRPVWLWKFLKCFGRRPAFRPVAQRDWFQAEGKKFFTFYTEPRLTVFLPAEEGVAYGQSLFRRVQNVMRIGGYNSWDMG